MLLWDLQSKAPNSREFRDGQVSSTACQVEDVILQSQFSVRRFAVFITLIGLCPNWIYGQNTKLLNVANDAATALIERAKVESASAWLGDGKMTFFHQADADSVLVYYAAQSKSMKRIAGSDVWTCQATLPDLEHGIMTYGFVATLNGKTIGGGGRRNWRGPKAPPPLLSSGSLSGSIERHAFESNSLGESRFVSVYIPGPKRKVVKVVYMADGDSVEQYAHLVDPLIEAGDLPPFAIIGTHSGVYQGEAELDRDDVRRNVRALEYVPSLNPVRFAQHESFFSDEVLKWAEQKYLFPTSINSRVVFGFSNGGSFSATMGIRHPDIYGSVIACALAGDRYDLSRGPKLTNEFFLVTGRWDTRFHTNVQYLHKVLTRAKVKCRIVVRAAEHDGIMWQEEFVSALKAIFSAGDSRQR